MEVCRWLERDSSPKRNIAILTDSQAAIKALYSTTTSSRLVGQCRDTLNHLGGTLKITLLWVPGHRNIEGNERADGLARQGSALGSPSGNTVGVPLAAVGGRVYSHYLAAAGLRWRRLTSCAKSRRIWPAYNIARSRELLCQMRACMGTMPLGSAYPTTRIAEAAEKEGKPSCTFSAIAQLWLESGCGHWVNHSLGTSVRFLAAGSESCFPS